MYYNYWGLQKPPFDNVPDPLMYVDCHASMENAIAETLFAIEEGNECIAVVVGDAGLGKTLSLRMIIDSLDHNRFKIALITNPSITFVQLMKEIIGQLTGAQCNDARKVDLLEIFNKILFDTFDEGKRVVICIDEANVIKQTNLENLRLLTNMQDDQHNLFTVVLAGQMELARRLEHPKRSNLFQRIGTYSFIEKISTVTLVKAYVESRLNLAGGEKQIFTDDVYDILWEHSDHGVPRLINKICKLSLKAGETNGFNVIDGKTLDQIGKRFKTLSGTAIQKRQDEKRDVDTSIDIKRRVPTAFQKQTETLPREENPIVPFTSAWHVSAAGRKNAAQDDGLHVISDGVVALTPADRSGQFPLAESLPVKTLSDAPASSKMQAERGNEIDVVGRPIEIRIGRVRISLRIPPYIVKKAKDTTHENRMRLAGALAAQALRQYPQLISSPVMDPVDVWGEIRQSVLTALAAEKLANAV
ncbi:MAG TPA: hypothetical protein ENO00_10775 [Deltaproteobacteria bacterium]|nr:hypothetical protein [Deltaproteobacteria bacterium]